jgi:transcriptional regulator with XRE-family HTH domain
MLRDEKAMEIVKKIKDRRIELEMSYQDLADKTGMSKSTLQRYETGEIRNIKLDKIEILAKGLNVTPEYLMGWEEPKQEMTLKEAIIDLERERIAGRIDKLLSGLIASGAISDPQNIDENIKEVIMSVVTNELIRLKKEQD